LDANFVAEQGYLVIQVTRPGSATSVIFGDGVATATPGPTQGSYLVVTDIEATRAELAAQGVEVSEVFHDVTGVFNHAGTAARIPGPDPEHRSYASFAGFHDPDGNSRFLQEITERLPGR
jgi:hypothetical protein